MAGGEAQESWPGCQDVDEDGEADPRGEPSRTSAIVLWLDDNRFLAGEGRITRGRHVTMSLNWLRPGVLRLGETYRVEVRNERGPRRSYRAWLRQIGAGDIALEIIEEDDDRTMP